MSISRYWFAYDDAFAVLAYAMREAGETGVEIYGAITIGRAEAGPAGRLERH